MKWYAGKNNLYRFEFAIIDNKKYEVRLYPNKKKWQLFHGENEITIVPVNKDVAKAMVDNDYKEALERNPFEDKRFRRWSEDQVLARSYSTTRKRRRTKKEIEIAKNANCHRCGSNDDQGCNVGIKSTSGSKADKSLCRICEALLIEFFKPVESNNNWSEVE